jgi:hypothetical protein
LLHVAEVIDWRRRRTPRWRQHSVPRRAGWRAPAPRREVVSPRSATEPPAPVVVLRIPRRSPIVARTTRSEAAGSTRTRATWTIRASRATGTTGTEPTGATMTRPARPTGHERAGTTGTGAFRTTRTRTTGPARATLHPRRTRRWCSGGRSRLQNNDRHTDRAADRRDSYKLIHVHTQAFRRGYPTLPAGRVRTRPSQRIGKLSNAAVTALNCRVGVLFKAGWSLSFRRKYPIGIACEVMTYSYQVTCYISRYLIEMTSS